MYTSSIQPQVTFSVHQNCAPCVCWAAVIPRVHVQPVVVSCDPLRLCPRLQPRLQEALRSAGNCNSEAGLSVEDQSIPDPQAQSGFSVGGLAFACCLSPAAVQCGVGSQLLAVFDVASLLWLILHLHF